MHIYHAYLDSTGFAPVFCVRFISPITAMLTLRARAGARQPMGVHGNAIALTI